MLQQRFNYAFGGLSAASAAELAAGVRDLTPAQREALACASGRGQDWGRFDPAPVGHLAFLPVGTQGRGDWGWHLLVPATRECRRLYNRLRRAQWARVWAPLGIASEVADRLFSLCCGHEPTMMWVGDYWRTLSAWPAATDRALRTLGFRPGHPHEAVALSAVRKVLGVEACTDAG